MNVMIFSYTQEKFDTGIPLEDVNEIGVSVVSGDELLVVFMKDGTFRKLDAADFRYDDRLFSFFNGSYIVLNEQLERWNNRCDSYDWAINAHEPVYGWL